MSELTVSGWKIFLIDWKRSRAEVTVYLRNGLSFTGRVRRVGENAFPELVQLESSVERTGEYGGRSTHQVLCDVDLNEVVAVRAVST